MLLTITYAHQRRLMITKRHFVAHKRAHGFNQPLKYSLMGHSSPPMTVTAAHVSAALGLTVRANVGAPSCGGKLLILVEKILHPTERPILPPRECARTLKRHAATLCTNHRDTLSELASHLSDHHRWDLLAILFIHLE